MNGKRKLNPAEQKLLAVCLLLGGVYLCYNGILNPLKKRLEDADRLVTVQQRRLQKNTRALQRARRYVRQHGGAAEEFRQSQPDEKVMAEMLSQIEDVAGGLRLKISSLQPQRTRRETYFNRFSISLALESSAEEVVHFLYIIQQQPYFFDVLQFSFQKSPSRTAETMQTKLVLSKIFVH